MLNRPAQGGEITNQWSLNCLIASHAWLGNNMSHNPLPYLEQSHADIIIRVLKPIIPGAWCYSGKTLATHVRERTLNRRPTSSRKAGIHVPLANSLKYRALSSCIHRFVVPFQLSPQYNQYKGIRYDVMKQLNKQGQKVFCFLSTSTKPSET